MKHILTLLAAATGLVFLAGPAFAQQPQELAPPPQGFPPGYSTGNPMFPGAGANGYPPQGFPGAGPMYPGAGNLPPGYPPPGAGGIPPMGPGPGPERSAEQKRYGLNPYISKIFGSRGGCDGCNKKKKTPPPLPEKVPMPVAQGGTLVYPNHPFVRGPRDYFMYGERGPAYGE